MLSLLSLLVAVAGTPWRTLETEHFRVHHPAEAAAWAEETAARMEDIRARVVAEVGWDLPAVVDVVVEDPYGVSNGLFSTGGWRREVRLWATPPPPDSILGHYRSWQEDLAVHEVAHLVHLTRPVRGPLQGLVRGVLGTDPMGLGTPRWVAEGYATVVEARLTGYGRPNGDGRAALLRALGAAGRMPSYGELNGSGRFLGGSYAYLVGSAFLEWLEAHDPGSLGDLWAAMTARRLRTFRGAFLHVYGEDPGLLYARFAAEVTHDAVALARARGEDDDTLWHEVGGPVSGLAAAPDGDAVALVRGEGLRRRVEVWPLQDDPSAAERFSARDAARRARDPDDPPAQAPRTFPPEASATRRRPDRPPGVELAWLADGDQLALPVWFPTPDGLLRPDLVLWSPETGRERRLTRGAWVTQPAATPDGDLVAVRSAWGATQLVRVSVADGTWTALTEPRVDRVVAHPAVASDGRLAYARNDGGWSLVVRGADGAEQIVALPERALVGSPRWGADGALYATVGVGGWVEIWRFDGEDLAGGPVTRTATAALGPTLTDDTLLYLVLTPDGLDVHRQPLGATEATTALPDVRSAVVRPAVTDVAPLAVAPVIAHAYRGSHLRVAPLAGLSTGPGRGAGEVGLVLSDVVPRASLSVLGGFGAGLRGGAVVLGLRGRLRVTARAFGVSWADDGVWRAGGAVDLGWTRRWEGGGLWLGGGGWVDGGPPGPANGGAHAALDLSGSAWLGGLRAMGALDGRAEVGADGGRPWARLRAGVGFALGPPAVALFGRYELGSTVLGADADGFTLGWFGSALVPEVWLRGRVEAPWVPAGLVGGMHRDRVHGGLLCGGVGELFFARDRLWGAGPGGTLPVGALSLAGAALTTRHGPRVPLPGTDGLDLTVGVGCLVEHPESGWRDRACATLDHWTAWATLRVALAR